MYYRFIKLTAVFILFCFVGIHQGWAEEKNLIKNSSFEKNQKGWSTPGFHHPKKVTIDTTTAAHGKTSLKLDGRGGKLFVDSWSTNLNIKPGKKYAVRVAIRRTSLKGNISLSVVGKSLGKWRTVACFGKSATKGLNRWVYFSGTFTFPKTTKNPRVVLYNINSDGVVWFDDINIKKITPVSDAEVKKSVIKKITPVSDAKIEKNIIPRVKCEDLGRNVKLKILVDKVMQKKENWVTKEWIVKATAKAGFNVFTPRIGHHKLAEVRQVTKWCEKYGIYHMPWMRGTLRAPKGQEADGKRVVIANGIEQLLWSPNSDELWALFNRYIIEYAKMPSLMGVFLDFENYAPNKQFGYGYPLSYDDIIMSKFAQSKDIKLPKLDFAERKPWLEKQDLHEEFSAFQINHWRDRCRALRKAVDEHNPLFQFCIYPGIDSLFMLEAVFPEWATKKTPLILADMTTYGRSSRFLSQIEALKDNRQKLVVATQRARKGGGHFMLVGGIDPVVMGADPEFCGKNAVMISGTANGYWVFYEGTTYDKGHSEYFKWFTWANKAITKHNFKRWHEPRKTAELVLPPNVTPDTFRLSALKTTTKKFKYPIVKLRFENTLVIVCKAGQPFELVLQNNPLTRYKAPLGWELRNSKMVKVASGAIPNGKKDTITFTPDTNGVYLLSLQAGYCSYSVISSTVPLGLCAGKKLSLLFGVKRFYFKVPNSVKDFTLTAKSRGGEMVRVNIFDPEGNQVATGQTSPKEQTVKIKVLTNGHTNQIWSIKTTQADQGTLEDYTITLDPQLPSTLSLIPEHVLVKEK